MSLKKICPHNEAIVCDYEYCKEELKRQRDVAFNERGARRFSYHVSMTCCMADYRECPRYLDFIAAQQAKTR